MDDVSKLMKRCQIGVGGRHALDDAHSIMADCYGTLGAQQAEIERLRRAPADEHDADAISEECDALRARMADLLTRTANALRGEPAPLTLHSWHDLPERAAAAIAAIDVMTRAAQHAAGQAEPPPGSLPPYVDQCVEIEHLRAQLREAEAEVEQLQKERDAALSRCLS